VLKSLAWAFPCRLGCERHNFNRKALFLSPNFGEGIELTKELFGTYYCFWLKELANQKLVTTHINYTLFAIFSREVYYLE
jgi:hypothetical protein